MHLPFKGNAQDVSGNGNHGTVLGATLTTDEGGNANSAYYFNGLNSSITVANNSGLSPAVFTICAKVNMQGFYFGDCYNNMIICKGEDRSTGSYSLRTTQTISNDCVTHDTLQHNYRCDVASINATMAQMHNAPFLQTHQWDCLVGVYDGTTVSMFVNGTLRYQYQQSITPANGSDISIGLSDTTSQRPYPFKEKIDEVRLYNRALNNAEVMAFCKQTVGVTNIPATNRTFLLSPSPAFNSLSMSLYVSQNEQISFDIIDLAGKKVFSNKQSFTSGHQSTTFDVSSLAKGVYLMQVTSTDGRKVERFLKD